MAEAISPAAAPPTPSATFPGESLTLYRSRLSASGARYEVLDSVALI